MYYLLTTGKIVTEKDMKLAFEIIYGENANESPISYYDWRDSVCGVEAVICDKNITVEELIKGDAFVDAVILYSKMHGCTLKEARMVVAEIRDEMEGR
jgi:hypothetical protein